MSDESITIRLAIPDEAALVAEHRARMFQDMGRLDAERASTMIEQVTPLVQQMLSSGEYVGWLARDGAGRVIGGAGVQLRRLLPRPETSVTREALVVNVYVQAAYRRKGLARRLMTAILEWCREQGIERIVLHASEMGRPLYTSLGFAPSGELVLYLQ
ncbi:MAG TPA: GNAT family N-acetyltransferase [Ktedonobacterales bacterium]